MLFLWGDVVGEWGEIARSRGKCSKRGAELIYAIYCQYHPKALIWEIVIPFWIGIITRQYESRWTQDGEVHYNEHHYSNMNIDWVHDNPTVGMTLGNRTLFLLCLHKIIIAIIITTAGHHHVARETSLYYLHHTDAVDIKISSLDIVHDLVKFILW